MAQMKQLANMIVLTADLEVVPFYVQAELNTKGIYSLCRQSRSYLQETKRDECFSIF